MDCLILEKEVYDKWISGDICEYPHTWKEFRDKFWVEDKIEYRSKSGDDIVVILFEDDY